MHLRPIGFAAVVSAMLTLTLVPEAASAQPNGGRSFNASSFCQAGNCSWLMFVNDSPLGSLSLPPGAWAAAQQFSGGQLALSPEMLAALGNCAACKSNSRPFVVPPGILMKLLEAQNVEGGDRGAGSQGDDVDDVDDIGSQESGQLGQGTGSSGLSGFVTGAVTPAAVVVTPEPMSLVLLATGLLALAPLARRTRDRDR